MCANKDLMYLVAIICIPVLVLLVVPYVSTMAKTFDIGEQM